MVEKNSSTHRNCFRCKEFKSLEEFSSHKGKLHNKNYTCKKCRSSAKPAEMLKYYGSSRNGNLYFKYKITTGDYDRMYDEQNGLCILCNRSRALVVDHCHSTSKVRGLLCHGCNLGIGQFEYDLSLFDKAKEYVISRS